MNQPICECGHEKEKHQGVLKPECEEQTGDELLCTCNSFLPQKESEKVSDCCGADIKEFSKGFIDDGGKRGGYWYCKKCGNECNVAAPMKTESWEEEFDNDRTLGGGFRDLKILLRGINETDTDKAIDEHIVLIKSFISRLIAQREAVAREEGKCDTFLNSGIIEASVASAESRMLEKAVEVVKSNSKGAFTDDAGNDCWYVDELLEALNSLKQ